MNTWYHSRLGTILGLVIVTSAHAGGIVYVDDDAPAGGDGTSWATAFRFLQDGLTAARAGGVSAIRVGQGTYEPDRDEGNPDGTGDTAARFELVGLVAIEGGYAGRGAPDPDARDLDATPSILSGDLLVNDGPEFTNYDDNVVNVVVVPESYTQESRLDGFEIRSASGDGLLVQEHTEILDCRFRLCAGAGAFFDFGHVSCLRCVFSGNGDSGARVENPTSFTACVFEDNVGRDGGGLSVKQRCDVTNCTFRRNTATGDGGAIDLRDSRTTVAACVIEDNVSQGSAGGVRVHFGTTMTDCVFRRNVAMRDGGAIVLGSSTPLLDGCVFEDNVGRDGGALYAIAISGTPLLLECVFTGNEARWGGACALRRGIAGTLLDCSFVANHADLGGGLHTDDGVTTVVAGCTFAENQAIRGAGMFSSSAFPRVIDCRFEGNEASDTGGGIETYFESAVRVVDTTFEGNVAREGAGIMNLLYSDPVIDGCTFTGNEAISGAGIASREGSDTVITASSFIANTASSVGGAIAIEESSAVTDCEFLGNRATAFGGAVHLFGGYDAKLTNCLFSGNTATEGGAVRCRANSDASLVNCTFAGNTADFGDVLSSDGGSDPALANCILWGNGDDPIDGPGAVSISYSDVQDGFPGVGNVDVDPLFVDADGPDDVPGTFDDDLRLAAGSPVVDAGDNDAVPPGTISDLDGNPRFVDVPGTPDTGNGTPPLVDLGAYERQADCVEDLDGSGAADFGDIVEILAAWGDCPPECPEDLDGSGAVDFGDVLAVLAVWGPCS